MAPEVMAAATGESILAAGEKIWVGAPVVLFTDSDGYSAYETELRFDRPPVYVETPLPGKLRYKPGRANPKNGEIWVPAENPALADVQRALDMFVLHYDVAGTSQSCFKILHDRRALSVHFMIDVDGTIYQTLDLADTAWHARQANSRSVGVEIAHIGAYPISDAGNATLDRWYDQDEGGTVVTLPKSAKELGVRTPRFEPRPARDEIQTGRIHGQALQQYDFTAEQYDSLVKLTAALVKNFPRIEPEIPRDAAGRVLMGRIPEEEEDDFHGIVGHHHVSLQKIDPGPAFDWEVFLARVKARLSAL